MSPILEKSAVPRPNGRNQTAPWPSCWLRQPGSGISVAGSHAATLKPLLLDVGATPLSPEQAGGGGDWDEAEEDGNSVRWCGAEGLGKAA